MATKNTTSREAKAQEILKAGVIRLFVGQGYALVQNLRGSSEYKVTKAGCTCPDFQLRQADCKHMLAVKVLCGEYHELKAKAEQGERVRPSSALLQALRWPVKQPKATGCRECGAATDFDVCSGCFFGQVAA